MSTETNGVFESEALSPAEAEYFSSKGEKADGLAPAAEPAPTVSNTETVQQAEPQTNEVDDDEGIYIDENGKPRSVISGKFVPHAALHKERERRKSVESEYMTVREKMARAEERLAVLNEVLQQPTAPQAPQGDQPEEVPDAEKDIFAFVKYQEKKIQELQQRLQQEDQQRQQQRGFQQLETAYKQDAQNFVKQTPDFPDAYSYIANSYAKELAVLGYDEGQIRQQLAREETNLVAEAFKRGMSPSQVLYERAKARGYTPKAAGQQPNAAAQKLDTIAKGQSTHKSLSSAGGASGEGLTVEALANMDEAEFAAVAAKLGKSKLRSLMGG